MTDQEAIQLLARWVATLQIERDSARRMSAWRMTRVRHLERRIEQLGSPMHRFWMDTYTPEQAAELARDLEPV